MSSNVPSLSFEVFERYMRLPQGGKIQAEYVWIGGSGQDLRCVPNCVGDSASPAWRLSQRIAPSPLYEGWSSVVAARVGGRGAAPRALRTL